MITKLTKAQQEAIIQYQQEGIQIGRSLEEIPDEKQILIIQNLYRNIGRKKPSIFFLSSPFGAVILHNLLVKDKIDSEIRSEIWSKIDSEIWSKIDSEIRSEIWSKIDSEIWSKIDREIDSEIGSEIWSVIEDKIDSEIRSEIWSKIDSEIWSKIDSEIWSVIEDKIDSEIGSVIEDKIDSEIRSKIDSVIWSVIWSEKISYPSFWCGQHNVNWIWYYKYFNDVFDFKPKDKKLFNSLINTTKLFWFLPYEKSCIISRKPTQMYLNEKGELHKVDGMALEFKDNWGIYALNGVRVPAWVIKTKPQDIIAKQYVSEPNVEVKREIFRKMGARRFLKMMKAKKIDNKWEYELYYTDLGVNTPTNFLMFSNASIPDIKHAEMVGENGEIKTVQEALNWRAQEILTAGKNWNPAQKT